MRLRSGLLVLCGLLSPAFASHVHEGDLGADGNTNGDSDGTAYHCADACADVSSMRRWLARVP